MMCKVVRIVAGVVGVAGWLWALVELQRNGGPMELPWVFAALVVGGVGSAVFGVSLLAINPVEARQVAYNAGWRDGRRAERLINGQQAQVIQLHRRSS